MGKNLTKYDLHNELIIDNFAGGGGASTGIERALRRPIDIAVNHDAEALAMHRGNHPQTLHLQEDVFAVDPVAVTKGRPVGLAWFSPDCKHHSKAKGGKPKDKRIRGLAWVVIHWVNRLREAQGRGPRIIMLENVEEFQDWCPVDADGKAKKHLKGWTFRCFVGALRRRGYTVEWRELRACDYGAPTIRKRLFVIARCDGEPIVWPEPTHGAPDSAEVLAEEREPWPVAADCIDWSIPCPSIFERKKPLADNTCKRIAKGIMRYVVEASDPFIVTYYNQRGFRGQPVDEPLRTQPTENRHALVTPVLASVAHGDSGGRREYPLTDPIGTVTASNTHALVTPVLVNCANSKTTGRGPNAWKLGEPVRTITSSPGFAVAAPVLTECANTSGVRVFDPAEPLRTQCAEVKGGHFALVNAFLAKHYTGVVGSDLKDPIGSVTATDHHSLVAANLVRHFGQSTGQDVNGPAPTVTAGGQGKTALATSHLVKLRGKAETAPGGKSVRDPLDTISAQGNHFGEVRAFLVKYYGNEKEAITPTDPLHTVTARERFALVTIKGVHYAIVDIGLRMLQPKELFAAQGFPADYIYDRGLFVVEDKQVWRALTKTAQVRMCGNSVCPPLAEALVKANTPDMAVAEPAA